MAENRSKEACRDDGISSHIILKTPADFNIQLVESLLPYLCIWSILRQNNGFGLKTRRVCKLGVIDFSILMRLFPVSE